MKNQEFQKLLIIFLIYRFKDYENSFYLYRALERMFDIYDYRISMDDLLNDDLVKKSTINNVHHYSLSEKGIELLNSNESFFIEKLKEKYLDLQPEYIKKILSYIDYPLR